MPPPVDPPRTHEQIKALQRAMNRFTKKYLVDVTPLEEDGQLGPATGERVKLVKYMLGRNRRTPEMGPRFRRAVRHPRTLKYSNAKQLARGARRRKRQRADARKNRELATRTTGVSVWEADKTVANWLHPYLDYARGKGWQGQVTSGYRDPAFSEELCRRMCGAPRCPGRCAGRSSNHAGSTKPMGAIDVTSYEHFGRLMRDCPLKPSIYNALGPADPVHFSATGH